MKEPEWLEFKDIEPHLPEDLRKRVQEKFVSGRPKSGEPKRKRTLRELTPIIPMHMVRYLELNGKYYALGAWRSRRTNDLAVAYYHLDPEKGISYAGFSEPEHRLVKKRYRGTGLADAGQRLMEEVYRNEMGKGYEIKESVHHHDSLLFLLMHGYEPRDSNELVKLQEAITSQRIKAPECSLEEFGSKRREFMKALVMRHKTGEHKGKYIMPQSLGRGNAVGLKKRL